MDGRAEEFLVHRGMPIASVVTNRAGDTDTIADTVNGDKFEIPVFLQPRRPPP